MFMTRTENKVLELRIVNVSIRLRFLFSMYLGSNSMSKNPLKCNKVRTLSTRRIWYDHLLLAYVFLLRTIYRFLMK